MYKYDIAISYANEQKDYVSRIYKLLELKGLSVYFAPAYQEELTGTDMTKEFYSIFHDQCLLIAAFVSDEYLQRKWTMAEAAIGLMRSREEKRNCLIPTYWGDARLPDFDPDIHFLTADKPAEIVAHFLAEAVRIHKGKSDIASVPVSQHGSTSTQRTSQTSSPSHIHNEIHITGGSCHIVQADTITGSNIQCLNGEVV